MESHWGGAGRPGAGNLWDWPAWHHPAELLQRALESGHRRGRAGIGLRGRERVEPELGVDLPPEVPEMRQVPPAVPEAFHRQVVLLHRTAVGDRQRAVNPQPERAALRPHPAPWEAAPKPCRRIEHLRPAGRRVQPQRRQRQ